MASHHSFHRVTSVSIRAERIHPSADDPGDPYDRVTLDLHDGTGEYVTVIVYGKRGETLSFSLDKVDDRR